MKRKHVVLGVVTAGAVAVTTVVASSAIGAEDNSGTERKAAEERVGAKSQPREGDVYADFSRITERSAGQFGSGDSVAGQWSWRTDGPGEYSITWDQENPENRERFLRSKDGEWLLLDGWGKKGVTYYEQRVTEEKMGDADCTNMKELPSEGDLQHYVRWNIPEEGYCLDARGTIVEEKGGPEITFRHRQVWSPPAPCGNAKYPDRVCITQHETWWDDNGHPYEKTLDRTIHLAKGLGMAFKIHQTFPKEWSAEMIRDWTY